MSATVDEDSHGRIFEKNNIKPPVVGRCGYFVKRKQRYCKMLPANGNKFCGEHLQHEQDPAVERKRIPCPLDPKHTVFEDRIKAHLHKCNATRKTQLPFYDENINIGLKDYEKCVDEKLPLYQTPAEQLELLIKKVKKIHDEIFGMLKIKENQKIHKVLQEELSQNEECGPNVKKHLLQQGSLVTIMEETDSLRDNVNIIEFGAGRGALSHWVQKAMCTKSGCKFFLVDRQHNRNKLDCYHKGKDQGPNFERLNIDIQHLNLDKVDALTSSNTGIVGIGKHLCGGATDLSLRCLLEEKNTKTEETKEPCSKKSKPPTIRGRLSSIVFALCCYHRCTWDTYVGIELFKKYDVTPVEFHRMTKMCTWSTCGFERRNNDIEHGGGEEESKQQEEENETREEKLHVKLGLSAKDQEEIGLICKQLVDFGRIRYVEDHGYEAHLVTYTSKDITPENIALVVTKKTS